MKRHGFALVASACAIAAAPSAAHARQAPGAPGHKGIWTPADKHGLVTSATRGSRVWQTLRQRTLTETYWPDLGTPAVRDLRFVVTDGRSWLQSDAQVPGRVEPVDGRSLAYRQVSTSTRHDWTLTKEVVTDPGGNAVSIRVRLDAPRDLRLYALLDPALSNTPDDDRAVRGGLVRDRHGFVRLAHTGRGRTISGYKGTRSDPLHLLRHARFPRFTAHRRGNVVVGTRLPHAATVALGFGRHRRGASRAARTALGFDALAPRFGAGWHAYLDGLPPAPPSVPLDLVGLYDRSLMVMHASEDKAHPGAGVASPSMPWAWGRLTIDDPSAPYHLVWSRDLYQVATAQLAAGDRAGAERALAYLLDVQQKRNGSFPQNSEVDGTPHWTNLQLDEVAFPIVLAWQLGRTDAATYAKLKKAADVIVRRGPKTGQERWENQDGWSPATIAAEIAGLVCAADIARSNGDTASAARWEATADRFQRTVEAWTATKTGPYSPRPYYLRVTKNALPDTAHPYAIGDGGPKAIDQRRVVDPSFLELVRLGVKRWDDPVVRNSLAVVDDKLAVDTPNGRFWHRFSFDGYGETRTGRPWRLTDDNSFETVGRAWPLFAGERGEYELLAGQDAAPRLRAMGGAANDGLMLPEQVWDGHPPFGPHQVGEGTFSATPLAWTHAQFVRLAWSIQAGAPVEQPSVVACRYVRAC